MKANEIKQVFVLNTVGSSGEREAVIAEKATWTLPVPGASERFIEIKGRMTNQTTAHLWLDGKDIESRGDKREKRYSQELWKQYWKNTRCASTRYQHQALPTLRRFLTSTCSRNWSRVGTTLLAKRSAMRATRLPRSPNRSSTACAAGASKVRKGDALRLPFFLRCHRGTVNLPAIMASFL